MRALLVVGLVLACSVASAVPAPFYDIVAIDGSGRVTRIAVSRFRRNPHGIEFKRVMLRERKKAKPGEVIKYCHEGSFAPGELWQGIHSTLVEPNPLPLSTPISPDYRSPDTFGLDGT